MKIIELLNTCAQNYLEDPAYLEFRIEGHNMGDSDNQEFVATLTELYQNSSLRTLIEEFNKGIFNNLKCRKLKEKEIQENLRNLHEKYQLLVMEIKSELEEQIIFKEKDNDKHVKMFLRTAAGSILKSFIKLHTKQQMSLLSLEQQTLLLSFSNPDTVEIREELFRKAFNVTIFDDGSNIFCDDFNPNKLKLYYGDSYRGSYGSSENSLTPPSTHSPLTQSPLTQSPLTLSPLTQSPAHSPLAHSPSALYGSMRRSNRSNSDATTPFGTPETKEKKTDNKRRTLNPDEAASLGRMINGVPSTNSTSSQSNSPEKTFKTPTTKDSILPKTLKLPTAKESFIVNRENTCADIATVKRNEDRRKEQLVLNHTKQHIDKFQEEHPIKYGAIRFLEFLGARTPKAFNPHISFSSSIRDARIPEEILEYTNQNVNQASASSSSNSESASERSNDKASASGKGKRRTKKESASKEGNQQTRRPNN